MRTDCTALLGSCQERIESESSILASGDEWKSSRLRAFDLPRAAGESSVRYLAHRILQERSKRLPVWLETVEDYSGRAFTRVSDRLPALSGLASELEQILNYWYVAGLWAEDILLWLLGLL